MWSFIFLRSLGDSMSAFTHIHTAHDVVLFSSLTCERAQRAGSCHPLITPEYEAIEW